MPKASKILGTGSYLPEKILTNFDIEKMVETSDAWIRERTGIAQRHVAVKGEKTTDLALKAATTALKNAGLKATDLDVIIFATVTPDQTMPTAACTLQAKLGAGHIMAFDLSAACSGFMYSLNLADSLIRTGQARHILVVGAETLSRIIDWKDRETCILFGDGAGAAIIGANDLESDKSGFHSFQMRANGKLGELLYLDSGRPEDPLGPDAALVKMPYVHMKGRDIFKNAVRAMTDCCEVVLGANKLTARDVDWFIPHQANTRIIEAVGDALGVPAEKTIVNIAKTGNTSSASIPIAFDEAVQDGRIRRGQRVLFGAFGAGLTYGATLFTY